MLDTTTRIAEETLVRLKQPSAVRFIRLGQGGTWAEEAIANGTIPFKYRNVAHAPCAAGNWDEVRRQILASGRKQGALGGDLRELRDFYELDDHCLWVTIAGGHLWWAFAEGPAIASNEEGEDRPMRLRRTLDGWHSYNLQGDPLTVKALSSVLTRVTAYQRTLCKVGPDDYLLRKIRGEEEPVVAEAVALKNQLEDVTARMISQLDWRDFEIMVDLIFARGGWQRQSATGDGEVDLDLFLTHPTTSESAWVQIKSSATQKVLDDYVERFRKSGADRFYFACHTAKGNLVLEDQPGMHVWIGPELARRALGAGLLDWLIEHVS